MGEDSWIDVGAVTVPIMRAAWAGDVGMASRSSETIESVNSSGAPCSLSRSAPRWQSSVAAVEKSPVMVSVNWMPSLAAAG